MTLGKGMAPFPAVAELKQTEQPKNFNVTNINTKGSSRNR